MTVKWKDVEADERYQQLDDEQKARLKGDFWSQRVAATEEYAALDEDARTRLHEEFFGSLPGEVAQGEIEHERTWGEAIKDAGLSGYQAASLGVQGITVDTPKLVELSGAWAGEKLGLIDKDEKAASYLDIQRRYDPQQKAFENVRKKVGEEKSDKQKQQLGRIEETIEDDSKGMWDVAASLVENPSGAVDMAVQSLADTVLGGVAGKMKYAQALESAYKAALKKGLTAEAAKKAAEKQALKVAGVTGTAVESLQAAAHATAGQSEQIAQYDDETLAGQLPRFRELIAAGVPSKDARDILAAEAGLETAGWTGAGTFIGGALFKSGEEIAKVFTGKASKEAAEAAAGRGVLGKAKAVASGVPTAVVAESGQEFVQSGAEAIGGNIATRNTIDENQEVFDASIGKRAVLGAGLGGLTGGSMRLAGNVAGVVGGKPADDAPADDAPTPPTDDQLRAEADAVRAGSTPETAAEDAEILAGIDAELARRGAVEPEAQTPTAEAPIAAEKPYRSVTEVMADQGLTPAKAPKTMVERIIAQHRTPKAPPSVAGSTEGDITELGEDLRAKPGLGGIAARAEQRAQEGGLGGLAQPGNPELDAFRAAREAQASGAPLTPEQVSGQFGLDQEKAQKVTKAAEISVRAGKRVAGRDSQVASVEGVGDFAILLPAAKGDGFVVNRPDGSSVTVPTMAEAKAIVNAAAEAQAETAGLPPQEVTPQEAAPPPQDPIAVPDVPQAAVQPQGAATLTPKRFSLLDTYEADRADDNQEGAYLENLARDLESKSDTDHRSFNPDHHTMADAVAMLGGIDGAHAGGEFDIKTLNKGRVGKPVIRAKGKGLTPDGMAEALTEVGFRTRGGQPIDPNSLAEMLDDESRGGAHWSTHKQDDDYGRPVANTYAGGSPKRLAAIVRKYLAGGDLGENQRKAVSALLESAYDGGRLGRVQGQQRIATAMVGAGFAPDDADAVATIQQAYEEQVPVEDLEDAILESGGFIDDLRTTLEEMAAMRRQSPEEGALDSIKGYGAGDAMTRAATRALMGQVADEQEAAALNRGNYQGPRKGTGQFAQPYRKQAQDAAKRAADVAAAEGIKPESAAKMFEALFPRALIDAVTGFYKPEDRYETMQRAADYVGKAPVRGFYVEVDLSNLGGLNEKKGNSEANVAYRRIAKIISNRLSTHLAKNNPSFDQVNFRHGGDEMSFFVFGENLDHSSIEDVLRSAQEVVWRYARDIGVHEIPHAKTPDDPKRVGVNFNFGVTEVERNKTPEATFKEADLVVEKRKKEPSYGYRKGEAAGAARPDAGAAGSQDGGDTGRGGDSGVTGAQGEAGRGVRREDRPDEGAGRDGDEVRLQAGQEGREAALDEGLTPKQGNWIGASAHYIVNAPEEYGPALVVSKEARDLVSNSPEGTTALETIVRPSGKVSSHWLYVSNGDGTYESEALGVRKDASLQDVLAKIKAKKANTEARRADQAKKEAERAERDTRVAKANGYMVGSRLGTIIPNTGKQLRAARIAVDHGNGRFDVVGVAGSKEAIIRDIRAQDIARAVVRGGGKAIEDVQADPSAGLTLEQESAPAQEPAPEPAKPKVDLFGGKTAEEEAAQRLADYEAEEKRKRDGQAERAARLPDGPLFDGSQNQTDIESVDLEEAGKILEAAGIDGKDRLDAIAKVRRGEYTLDDLRAAFPQKESAPAEKDEAGGKKPAKVTPQIASERQLASMVSIAADSIADLRAIDVDRVLSEAPAHFRLSLAQHIKSKRKDLAAAVDEAMEDIAIEGMAEAEKPEATQQDRIDDKPAFSLRPETKAAYEARIDALASGQKANYKGVKILDRADILDLLGHGDKPLHLVESAVGKKGAAGSEKHPGMTAEQWKRVPEWIENPVAVFRSDTVSNRLTLVAPETVDGKPVLIVLEPGGSMGGLRAHVLVNAYEKDNPSAVPTGRWVKEQKLLFLDQKKSPAFSERSGLQLPGEVRQLRGYARKVLTEADLFKYRQTDGKAETPKARLSTDNKPVGIPRKEAQRLLNKHDASVKAVQSYADLDPEIRAEAQRQGAKPSDIKGVHWRGKSWVIADNVTADEVQRVALHEGMHGKLRQAYGREVENKMALLASNLPGVRKPSLRVLALAESQGITLSEYVKGLNKDTTKTDRQKLAILTEELLTHVEEGRVTAKGKLRAYLEAVVGAIRAFLRKHGFAQFADYGITDIQHLLRQAREYGEQIEMSGEVPAFMVAWHGTPHEFDAFSLEHMGKGEGAQAYGWGLYFAGKREVAEFYRESLSTPVFTYHGVSGKAGRWLDDVHSAYEGKLSRSEFESVLDDARDPYGQYADITDEIDSALEDGRIGFDENTGQLYKVDIPEDGEYLLWDKPVPEETVRKIAEHSVERGLVDDADEAFEMLADEYDVSGAAMYRGLSDQVGGDEAASKFLNEIGIPGIKYLDGTSRGAGDGSYNYVIFDDAAIKILEREQGPAFGLREGDPETDALVAQYASVDGTPSEAEIREARKQYRETERAYGGREAYEKAKADGRTKLNYSQWVTVRTPNFKRWFGDWEALQSRKFLDGEPVTALTGNEFAQDGVPLTEKVPKWYAEHGASTVYVDGIGSVQLDLAAVKNSLSHGIGRDKAAAFAAVPDILRGGRIIHAKKMDRSTGGTVFHVAAPISIGGRSFVADVLVRSDMNAKRMYVHEVVLKEKLQQESAFKTGAIAAEAGKLAGAEPTGAVRSVLQHIYSVNPSEVSKVTDPTTGEPMVVYHATDADITKFDRSRLGQNTSNNTDAKAAQKISKAGFWFSEKPLAGDLSSAVDMPVFIVINRPYRPRSVLGSMWAKAERGERIIKNMNDGVIVPDDEFDGATSFVVKNPAQIKSATGNVGTFGPASDIRFSIAPGAGQFDQDVRYRTDGKPWANRKNAEAAIKARGLEATHKPVQTKAGWVLAKAAVPPKETAFRKAQRRWQDKFNRFRVIQDWLAENGISLTEQADVFGAETLMRGRQASRIEDFREKQVRPLMKRIAKAGISMAEVSDFLHAQHAVERNRQTEKVSGREGGSGMSDMEAAEKLAEYQKNPKLVALANEYRAITDQTRQMLLDSGIISQEQADAWQGAYQHYVPLKGGQDEAIGNKKPGGAGVFHRATGHEQREDGEWITENILRDHEWAIMQVERNRVGKALLNLALESGDHDLITIGKPEKRAVLKNGKAYVVTLRGQPLEVLERREDAEALVAALGGKMAGASPQDYAIETTTNPSVIYQARPQLADNETVVYVAGNKVRIQFNDPLMARSWNNLGEEQMNVLLRMGKDLNNWLSRAYTGYNPQFLFTNIARDLIGGTVNLAGEHGALFAGRTLLNYPKAWAALARHEKGGDKLIKEYRDDGGSIGAAYMSDLERIGADVEATYDEYRGALQTLKNGGSKRAAKASFRKLVGAFVGWIEVMNRVGENALRVAAYQTAREAKMSRHKAAIIAKESTINFSRRGEVGQVAGAMYLFFNPAVQGTAVIAHALAKGKNKHQAQAMVAGLATLGYLLAQSFGGGPEDEWEKVSDYEKERNFLIWTGSRYLKIPVPYGYGAAPTAGRYMAEVGRGSLPMDEAALRLAATMIGEFTLFGAAADPDGDTKNTVFLLPTAAQIPASVAVNRTSFGSPVYPDSKFTSGDTPDSQQMFRSSVGTHWEAIAKGMNMLTGGDDVDPGKVDVSPETLKYLTHTFTGGAGKFVSDSFTLMANLAGGVTDIEAREVPIARSFVGSSDSLPGARSRFYRASDKVRAAEDRLRRAEKLLDGGDLKGKAAQIEAEQGFLLNLGDSLDEYSKWVKEVREEILGVQRQNLPTAEKRQKIKALEKEEAALYDEFMRIFKEEERKQKAAS